MTAVAHRAPMLAHKAFDAKVPLCPKCAQPLRRITGDRGSFYVTCDNSTRREYPGHAYPRVEKCGQTSHVLAVDGVAIVSAISKEQFERFRRTYPSARQVYTELGLIIPTRVDGAEGAQVVPEHNCSGCGTPTKLFDLYGGECRECHAKKAS